MEIICIFFLFFAGNFVNSISKDIIEYSKKEKQFETIIFRFEENLNFSNPFNLLTNEVGLQIIKPVGSQILMLEKMES